jgi:hypothetical protein
LVNGGFTTEEQLELFGDVDLTAPDMVARVDEAMRANAVRKRQAKLQAVSIGKGMKHLKGYQERYLALSKAVEPDKVEQARGRAARAALNSLLVRDIREIGGNISVEQTRDVWTGWAHAQMDEFLEAYRPKKAGFSRDNVGLENFVRELYGTATGDVDAAAIAKQWNKVSERLRQEFNKAGGDIKRLEDWNLPQSHDAYAVSKVTFDEWYNYITPLLDRNRMELDETNMREIMEYTYNAIRTEGVSTTDLSKITPTVGRGGKLANRYRDSRYLHFKDGESWLAYQKRFGTQNIAATITDHIEAMARDIAIMRNLGPNPNQTVQYMAAWAAKEGGDKRYAAQPLKIWNNLKGMEPPENATVANVFGTLRNVQTFSKLGSAWISSWTDTMLLGMTANYNGFGGLKTISRMKDFADPEVRKAATRMGIIADYAVDRAMQSHRFGEVAGTGLTKRLSDQTLKLSFLTPWTNAAKQAFHMEFLANLADVAGKSLDELPDNMQRGFKTYGITAEDWNVIRRAPKHSIKGENFVNPMALDDMDLVTKLNGMIYAERTLAVPEGDARVRALLNQGLSPGTLGREMLQTFTQFKTFPVSLMLTHLGRAFLAQGNVNRLGYMAQMFTGMTLIGGLAYQAKEISKGRDPIDPTENPQAFWTAAALQGGGLGIFGDFLFSDQTRFGQNLSNVLTGPSVDMINKFFVKGTLGNVQKMVFDDKSFGETFGQTGVDALNLLPYQTFYNRLAFERLVRDQMGRLANPKWDSNKQKAIRRKKRDTGQEYWWKPGQVEPARPPEL